MNRIRLHWLHVLCAAGFLLHARPAAAEERVTRCVAVEVYYRAGEESEAKAVAAVQEFAKQRANLRVLERPLDGEQRQQFRQRLQQIARHYRVSENDTPLLFVANRVVVGKKGGHELVKRLESALTVDVFARASCSRCQMAKVYVEELKKAYPALTFRVRDILSDSVARSELQTLANQYRKAAASVPVFHLMGDLIVGFDEAGNTRRRVGSLLEKWSYKCPPVAPKTSGVENRRRSRSGAIHATMSPIAFLLALPAQNASDNEIQRPLETGDVPPLPIPGLDDPPLPEIPDDATHGELLLPDTTDSSRSGDEIDLPLFGLLSASGLGLPLFTIAVGLVDGFNPCAMWVLLFLLSILVNLKDRWKILAVAGVFVLISGLAYFAFMAAWFNVFSLIGYLRPVQLAIACLAIFIGLVHIKDYFAFKQGLSLSIPDSAKPGIYAKVRRIMTAENLWGAVAGAAVLAVLVNIVELLCTAGLPALYSEILSQQQLPTWQNYAYLGLYNVAYMFDDGLMVAIVVTTLDRRKMQEKHGRVLKLISGTIILLLGLLMVFKPDWLL